MADSEIVGFIKSQILLGKSKEYIEELLLNKGWDELQVEGAVSKLFAQYGLSEPILPIKKADDNLFASPEAVVKQKPGTGSAAVPAGQTQSAASRPVNEKIPSSNRNISQMDFYIKRLVYLLIFILIIGVSASGVMVFNYFFNNPEKIISQGIINFGKANSFTVSLSLIPDSNSGQFTATADYQKDFVKKGQIKAEILKIEGNPNKNITLSAVFDKKDVYINANISFIEEIEKNINTSMPQLTGLRSYQIVKPVVRGEKYLHFKIPATSDVTETNKKNIWDISDGDRKILEQKFVKSLQIRKTEDNYTEDGEKYKRIVLGLKKKELIEFVEYFKKPDVEIKVSDINPLIKLINSSNGWDNDLVELLIGKGNYIHSLSVSLPRISDEALKDSISVKPENGKKGLIEGFIPNNFGDLLGKSSDNLQHLGKATFTNYNSVIEAQVPVNYIEYDQIAEIIQQEIGPVINTAFSIQPTDNDSVNSDSSYIPDTTKTPVASPVISTRMDNSPSPTVSVREPVSFAEKEIEEGGMMAKIEDVTKEGNEIKIKVLFINTSQTSKTIFTSKVQMRSQTHGTPVKNMMSSFSLNPGEKKEMGLVYEIIPNPPFRWIYISSGGKEVELGSY